ncbi:glioma pathogenesis-related protein 1-like [Emydura macquarii macquarii]|uniref:glioma pathogenesis-related protein 1-like n=1 Tax=Emydura macquarii macquarii TaxID=1129001 RepID=UPI00352AE365
MKIILSLPVLVILDLSVCCYSYESNTLPDIEDKQFIEECVTAHNRFRSLVNPAASNMRHMSWDPDLAKTARAWAKTCQFKHNIYLKIPGKAHPIFTPVGENIWTGSLQIFSVTAALTYWYNEFKDYTYSTNTCTYVCGHYTQVVWATSYKVGCAVHFCPTVTGFHGANVAHFICNYGPAGNYPGQPYETGAACSECNGEKCVDRLCENPERDKVISNSGWYPDWDKAMCDQYCIIVLVLRPSLIVLTFGAVCFLQKHYPQVSVSN